MTNRSLALTAAAIRSMDDGVLAALFFDNDEGCVATFSNAPN